MYTKNYYEMKSAITDGLNEFCKNKPNYTKKEKINFSEILKTVITILPILSAIFTLLFKFISMSSVWYYQFDFNYYDFSISKVDLFIFIYTIISVLTGIVIALTISYLLKQLLEKFPAKKIWIEIFINLFIVAIIFILISLFIDYLLVFDVMCEYYLIVSIFSYGITFMFLPNNRTIKKSFKILVVVGIILIGIFSGLLFKSGYKTAQENKEFQIVNYCDTVSENESLYVVISESKDKFSAYMCEIGEDGLTVYTNYHKYFDNSIDYEVYSFENIDYIQKKNKYNGEKYEYITEKYNIEPIEE